MPSFPSLEDTEEHGQFFGNSMQSGINNIEDFLFTTFGVFILISYAFPIVGIVLVATAILFKELKSLKEIKIKEFKQSVKQGAVNEPHMLRSLKKEERELLERKSKRLQQFINNPLKVFWASILIFAIIFLGCLVLWQVLVIEIKDKFNLFLPFHLTFWMSLAISSIFTYLIIKYSFNSEKNLYLDTRLAVMQIQGHYIPFPGNTKKSYYFSVRSISFYVPRNTEDPGKYNKRLRKRLQKFKKGDEIIVEYSPFSKQVWDIKKG